MKAIEWPVARRIVQFTFKLMQFLSGSIEIFFNIDYVDYSIAKGEYIVGKSLPPIR